MNIYSLRDTKAEAFNRPFFSLTRATAMREISLGIQKDQTMSSFAGDFALYELGEFDTITGRLVVQEPYHVCDVNDLINPPEPEED